jgi:hypothetical protein
MTDLEERVSKLEGRVTAIEKICKSKTRLSVQKDSLPDKILELRDSGFFSTQKIDVEVHKKLEELPYHCELNRVGMALLRLQRKGELRKSSKPVNGKSHIAYVR